MASAGVSPFSPTSTIDLAASSHNEWDAIVVGGGLAGSVSARGLAAAGYRTLLVDRSRFPRTKVCGCCVTSLAAQTLDSIGLGHVLDACGARPLHEVHLYAGAKPTRIPIHGVAGLSREVLDARLLGEASVSGAALLLQTRAEPCADGTVLLHGEETVEARARVVILAAGLRAHDASSAPRRGSTLVGIGAVVPDAARTYPEGVVRMVIDRTGYVGIAPLEDGRLAIASAVRADAVQKTSPRGVVEGILQKAGLAGLLLEDTRFSGVPALRRRRVRVHTGRMLSVGDAAGFVEPITGEGMSWAIATGAAVVGSATALLENHPETNAWQDTYRRMMPRRHLRCALVGAFIRRPALVRVAVGVSSLVPIMRSFVLSGLLGRYDPAIEGEMA